MVWYLPIGVYEGIKMTSEITDSTVNLSADGEIPHAVLRVGAGAIPVAPEYDSVLHFLAAAAPNELAVQEWIAQQADSSDAARKFGELAEDGMIMSVGEYAITDPRFAKVVVQRAAPMTQVADDTAEPEDDQLLVNAGGGEYLVGEAMFTLVNSMDDSPVPVRSLFAKLRDVAPAGSQPHIDQAFEADLKSLVATGAVRVYHMD